MNLTESLPSACARPSSVYAFTKPFSFHLNHALKTKLITAYGIVGLLVHFYQWLFGPGISFGVALGKAIVWLAVIFPSLGGIMGAVLLVAVLAIIYFA